MKRTLTFALLGLLLLAGTANATTLSLGRDAATAAGLMSCAANKAERIGFNEQDGQLYRCNGVANVQMGQITALTVPAASVTAGVTAVAQGLSFLRQTVYTLTAVSLTMTDAAAAGSHGSIQLLDYPASLFTLLGGTSDLSVTAGVGGIGDTAAVVCSLGAVTLSVADAALTSTEADTIPSTAATLTGGVGAFDGEVTAALAVLQDGTATAKDLWLNRAVPDAGSSADDTLVVAGTITISTISHGDN